MADEKKAPPLRKGSALYVYKINALPYAGVFL